MENATAREIQAAYMQLIASFGESPIREFQCACLDGGMIGLAVQLEHRTLPLSIDLPVLKFTPKEARSVATMLLTMAEGVASVEESKHLSAPCDPILP